VNFDPINEALNVNFIEEQIAPFRRIRSNQKKHILKLGNNSHSGRQCTYPWRDPEYQIGDCFFKHVSKEDVDDGKGRPNVPPSLKHSGRRWTTTKAYDDQTKQYGYLCERVQ
tara:strand:+ start:179 stop:514 length:336 start_codon:yes stop_codon:yes gene_type:complete